MREKITTELINTAFNMAFDYDQPIRDKAKELFSIKEAIIHLAGAYFWLPAFELLKEAELVNEDLTPGDILIYNGFTIQGYTRHVDDPLLEYYLTRDGFDFLEYVLFVLVEAMTTS